MVIEHLEPNMVNEHNTMFDPITPTLVVDAFDFFVKEGNPLAIRYVVGDDKVSNLQGTTDDTYTTRITCNDFDMTETTRAGFHAFVIPAQPVGEHKFFIQTIDKEGRESNKVQFDFIVLPDVEPKVHIMTIADMKSYSIVPDDDSEAVAKANANGFSQLFESCKQNGYDKIVLLNNNNNTYYIWSGYNGTNKSAYATIGVMKLQSNFTIDMNGSTFATPVRYIEDHVSAMIEFYKITNAHIENGTLRGMYAEYDFNHFPEQESSVVRGEHQSTLQLKGARFCSLRNVRITNSLGYDTITEPPAIGTDSVAVANFGWGPTVDDNLNVLLKEGYIGLDGEIHEETESGYKYSPFSVIPKGGEMYVGKYLGYGGYNGARTIFVHWYDANKNYLGYTKTEQHLYITPPENTKYCRICVKGTWDEVIPKEKDKDGNFILDSGGNKIIDKVSCTNLLYVRDCVGIMLENCRFDNDRTAAIGPGYFRQQYIKNCTFENIGKQRYFHEVTAMLADYEDGWQHMQMIWWEGNECIKGLSEICIKYGYNTVFKNNKGLRMYWNMGGVENTLMEGNCFTSSYIDRTMKNVLAHKTVWVNNNFVGTLHVNGAGNDSSSVKDEYFYNCNENYYMGNGAVAHKITDKNFLI